MTASDSSSSAAVPAERTIDLAREALLPPLAATLVDGRDRDLLAPLRWATEVERVPEAKVDRAELAKALGDANAAYGHPRAAPLAAALAEPGTRVVVTGQQPGLLGGPLYTLWKAVGATLWAQRLSAAGTPAVPVFWMATEDHDFREVSWTVFDTPDGPRRLDLGEDPAPLVPVGMRSLGDGVERLFAALRQALPGESEAAWLATLATWYRPTARFGEAFARLLAGLLGDRCPLLLDSMLPAVKQAQRPWLARLVERRREVEAGYREADARIEERGHGLQVAPQPEASPLFLVRDGARRRVLWEGPECWTLRGEEGAPRPVGSLLEAIAENPTAVGPGVLARPAIQDAMLGTTLQVMGPGELSYLPQVAPLYELLEIAPPAVSLRPMALVLEAHQRRKLEGLEWPLADLLRADLDIEQRLAGGRGAEALSPVREAVESSLTALRQAAMAVDADLERPWEKTRGQIHRALDQFDGKLVGALARRNQVARQRAHDLRSACRPLGESQERILSTAYFPGRYGDHFVDAVFEQLVAESTALQVITP